MSGIYILKTKDGYRVSYTDRYSCLVGIDTNLNYFIVGKVASAIFSNCYKYDKLEDAIEHAKVISRMYLEVNEGISVVTYAENMTFKELIKNGKNN